MLQKLIEKCLSGRFVFTVVCAGVFAWLSINKTLPPDKVMEVVLVVVMAYFSRNDRGQNGKESVK